MQDDVDRYLSQRGAGELRATTVAVQRRCLTRVARRLEARGHRRWSTVTTADLEALVREEADRGLRQATRVSTVRILRAFGRWLQERGRVLRDPAADLAVPNEGEPSLLPAPLSEGEVARLFAAVPRRHVVDLRIRLHLDLLYSCALRNAEAVALDVADLDLDRRSLLVRDGKGGRSSLLPLLGGSLAAASDYLALRRELLRGPDTGALLLGTDGRRLAGTWMQTWLPRAGRRLGLHVYPHLLRHSIAVHVLRRGADIRYVQLLLRHACLDTTKIYLRLVPGHLRQDYDNAMPPLLPEGAILPGSSPAGQG